MNEARRLLNYEVVRRTLRGESMRAIARAMGLAPRTVKKILAREELRRTEGEAALERELPARRTPRASKLDVFEERIAAWLERYPDLTSTRLLEELTREGFDGGYTIVRQHLNAWRAEHAAPKRADLRVETPPGQRRRPARARRGRYHLSDREERRQGSGLREPGEPQKPDGRRALAARRTLRRFGAEAERGA
jgi:hypothetical protein